jgi:choline dehydrogenase
VSFAHIVVGGGSAGCVAASRLVREFGAKVLLLEAGGGADAWLLRIPAGFIKILSGTKYLTQYRSVPQGQLGGRIQLIPQAKVLGGGSSVNAQAYMRGRVADYDAWGTIADTDLWAWEKILPHFRRLEGNQKFNNRFHGSGGPLKVSDPGFVCEVSHIFVRTLQGMGLPYTPDFNIGAPAGVGYLQMTAARGRRCSAVDAFLRPLAGDGNLQVRTYARVLRIILERGRAVGVEYTHRGETRVAHADGDILLAAGTFVSPQILMLSGIGPAEQLRKFGIAVVADLPGVGANLQDHPGAPIIARARGRHGYYRQDRGHRMLVNGVEYLLFGRGRVTTNGVEACSFHVPEDGTGDPVIQIYCVPTTSYVDEDVRGVPSVDGVSLHAVLLRPRSTGWVRLGSASPFEPPLINPNYLAHADDARHLLQGLQVAREILRCRPLSDIIEKEILPGADTTTDAALKGHMSRTVKTDFHPVGTCRMGRRDDAHAVVGPDLKVRGVEALRVIDASVMPKLVSANTNAPTMVIADRAVSLMRGIA